METETRKGAFHPESPCQTCRTCEKNPYNCNTDRMPGCTRWRAWFSKRWQGIQEAAEEILIKKYYKGVY